MGKYDIQNWYVLEIIVCNISGYLFKEEWLKIQNQVH